MAMKETWSYIIRFGKCWIHYT